MELKLSANIIHSRMDDVKNFFERVLHCDKIFFEGIPCPKKKVQRSEGFRNVIIKHRFRYGKAPSVTS